MKTVHGIKLVLRGNVETLVVIAQLQIQSAKFRITFLVVLACQDTLELLKSIATLFLKPLLFQRSSHHHNLVNHLLAESTRFVK